MPSCRPTEGLFGLREWLEEGFYPEGMEAYAEGAVYENFGGRKRNNNTSGGSHHHHRERTRDREAEREAREHAAAASAAAAATAPQATPSRATPGRASKARAAALWQAESEYISDDDDPDYKSHGRKAGSELSGARVRPACLLPVSGILVPHSFPLMRCIYQ